MSNLGSESEFLDIEKGKGSDLETASASASVERAAAPEEEDTELVADPRKARQVNFAVVVFCVAAIVVFVYSVYSMYNGTVPFWEAFGYCTVYFVICAVSIGTALMVRKPLISIYAAAARPAVAAATTAAGPDATTSTPCPGAAATDPMKFLFLLP